MEKFKKLGLALGVTTSLLFATAAQASAQVDPVVIDGEVDATNNVSGVAGQDFLVNTLGFFRSNIVVIIMGFLTAAVVFRMIWKASRRGVAAL